MSANIGKIVQVIGAVIDVEFPEGKLPSILNALEINNTNNVYAPDLIVEVARITGGGGGGRLGRAQRLPARGTGADDGGDRPDRSRGRDGRRGAPGPGEEAGRTARKPLNETGPGTVQPVIRRGAPDDQPTGGAVAE